MSKPLLKTIDLFSGIGGISYALSNLTETILYCDIDFSVQRVLKARMASGHIHTAPIVNDVRNIEDMAKIVGPDSQVDLLISSSSCVGFSNVGKRKGLNNPETGMMMEMLRVVERFQPKMVFLENVAGITKTNDGKDMNAVMESFHDMGYDTVWGVFSAADVGAWHQRRRWFCLAKKRGVELPTGDKLPLADYSNYKSLWGNDTPPVSYTSANTAEARTRLRQLGNSVVPDCVRHAFVSLYKSVPIPGKKVGEQFGAYVNNSACGLQVGDSGLKEAVRRELEIYLDPHKPNLPLPTRVMEVTSGLITERYRMRSYPTPRAQNIASSSRLTNRASRDLGTVVKFQEGVPWEGRLLPNPQFVEFLMGFPKDFTSPQNVIY